MFTKENTSQQLVLDELFDLSLYKKFYTITKGDLQKMLGELVVVETRHLAFWQEFFGVKINKLNHGRRVRLVLLFIVGRIFGEASIHLILEAIEVHGIRKYLSLWKTYQDDLLGGAVREILEDEFKHEDEIVSEMSERKIYPQRIRDIFLGFNDGLVEILGAVSGFFASLHATGQVLVAAVTVAFAGSFSMAAGAYAAGSSEKEIEKTDREKKEFLQNCVDPENVHHPLKSAVIVGIAYLIGATVPILPVFFGARQILWPLAVSAVMVIVVSYILAFLSGMRIAKRIGMNLVIIALAVGITYMIGILVKSVFGVAV